jgi:hypothetical protein
LNTNLKVENSLAVKEDNLSITMYPHDKIDLGCDNRQKNVDESANHVILERKETNPSYDNMLKSLN